MGLSHRRCDAPAGFVWVRQGLDINGTLSPSLCPVGSSGYTRGGGPPTVADFDGDGAPLRSRWVWNQRAYHITNVNEDGTLPAIELPNYAQPRLNNFRQNKQPLGEFSAPDLVVAVLPKRTGDYGSIGRVRNIGEASVPAGVLVRFSLGAPADGVVLGDGVTTTVLYSLDAEEVQLELSAAAAGLVTAVVDDGFPEHPWQECRTDNDESAASDVSCDVPQ